jgi:hypothetical protein
VLHTVASTAVRCDGELPRIDTRPRLEGRAPQEVWGFAVLTNGLRGPSGEDVDEEELDAVKS